MSRSDTCTSLVDSSGTFTGCVFSGQYFGELIQFFRVVPTEAGGERK